MKGTSIFGGVQVFSIFISAIRLKFVAVILGPSGMAIAGLFNTASLTIQQFLSLGLNLSVVKEIGQSKENKNRLGDILAATLPLILISELLGSFACLLFPQTSIFAYFWEYCLHRRISYIICSSILLHSRECHDVCTSGIVPAMIVLALSTCIWYFLSLRNTLQVSASP